MVAEVVVGVAEHNVECHSAIEFPEILPYIGATAKNEIYDVQIAIILFISSAVLHPEVAGRERHRQQAG